MTDANPDEVRVRVTVDSDTPELLKRLAGSKRQPREIVHLLRLGLHMEMMLSGKVPMVGMVAENGTPATSQTTSPTAEPTVPTPVVRAPGGNEIPSGEKLAELTGLDADYFSAPVSYQD